MTLLLVLAAAWVVALVPPAVRGRGRRRQEPIGQFDRMRGSLAAAPEPVREREGERDQPRSRRRRAKLSPARRKRRVLKVIAFALMATLAIAVQQRTRLAWGIHLLVHDVLLAYLAMIVRESERAARRRPALAVGERVTATAP